MIDEIQAPRHLARQQLMEELYKPLDPEDAVEYQRDRWGQSPGQLQAVMATEALMEDATYE